MKTRLDALPPMEAAFVEPMMCEPVAQVPDGPEWLFEVKMDGFRILAVKPVGGEVTLLSRKGNSLNRKFFYVADDLKGLPEGTVLDGELVALDAKGRSSFSLLQSFRSQERNIYFYAFDVICLRGHDLRGLSLVERKVLLKDVLGKPDEHVRLLESVDGDAAELLVRIRKQKLEGIIGKRKESRYEDGERSGAWVKHRVNQGQEFVVGGYVPGTHGFEALVVGFYRGKDLIYVTRLRNGFTPAIRREVFAKIKHLAIPDCPFVNLPQEGKSRWGGEGLNAEKMKQCVWLKPVAVVQAEFLEWTGESHLRHAKFVRMREDKDASSVMREG